MAYKFDIRVIIKAILGKIVGSIILLILYIDLKLLYNCLVKLNITQNKNWW